MSTEGYSKIYSVKNVYQFSTDPIGLYSASVQGENWNISFGYSYSQNIQLFQFASLKDESYKVVKEMYSSLAHARPRSRHAICARCAVELLFLLIKPTCSRHRCLTSWFFVLFCFFFSWRKCCSLELAKTTDKLTCDYPINAANQYTQLVVQTSYSCCLQPNRHRQMRMFSTRLLNHGEKLSC